MYVNSVNSMEVNREADRVGGLGQSLFVPGTGERWGPENWVVIPLYVLGGGALLQDIVPGPAKSSSMALQVNIRFTRLSNFRHTVYPPLRTVYPCLIRRLLPHNAAYTANKLTTFHFQNNLQLSTWKTFHLQKKCINHCHLYCLNVFVWISF